MMDGWNYLKEIGKRPWTLIESPESFERRLFSGLNEIRRRIFGFCLVYVFAIAIGAQAHWTSVPAPPGAVGRLGHGAIVHDGKLWVLGGLSSDGILKNDVWNSTDGVNWNQIQAATPWRGRTRLAALSYDNRLWIMGGADDDPTTDPIALFPSHPLNDVWSSVDGVNWTSSTLNAAWEPRWGHGAVVFQDKIWILGGLHADVWNSTDGVVWNRVIQNAPWGSLQSAPVVGDLSDYGMRTGHAAVVFDNSLWILGGAFHHKNLDYVIATANDVWRSSDGETWERVTSSAQWLERGYFSAVVFDGRMCLAGGRHAPLNAVGSGASFNDVWTSADGLSWAMWGSDHGWEARWQHSLSAHQGCLWLIGPDSWKISTENSAYCWRDYK